MTTLEKIDLILDIYYNGWSVPFSEVNNKTAGKMNHVEREEIIKLLFENNHIAFSQSHEYRITVKGILFKEENGGYKINAEREKMKMKTQSLKDRLLLIGSWMAGFGALALVLLEVAKKYDFLISVEVATCSFIFLCGIIAGIIIYMLLVDGLNRGQK